MRAVHFLLGGVVAATVGLFLHGCGGRGVLQTSDAEDMDSLGEGASVFLCPGDCDDGNPCTSDFCSAEGYCEHIPVAQTSCDDGNACTTDDRCDSNGGCAGKPLDCSDENACTLDQCDPATGCTNTPVPDGAACDDGNLCTLGESCQAGVCLSGTEIECKDPNPGDCRLVACAPKTGLCSVLVDAEEDTPCKDGKPCTTDDKCDANGTCVGGPEPDCGQGKVPCWNAWCNEFAKEGASDLCTGDWKAEGVGCDDDDVCTTGDTCTADGEEMACTGTPVSCDDGNPCTDDLCSTKDGCVSTAVEDGTSCTLGPAACFAEGECEAGLCVGNGVVCNDGNPCTDDFCDPEVPGSCLYVPNTATCDDGDVCTANDFCAESSCVSGENPCVGDCLIGECTPTGQGYACVPVADGTPCDDGNAGTAWDLCQAGECVGFCGQGKAQDIPCAESDDQCEAACGTPTGCDGMLTCIDGSCQTVPGSPIVCQEHPDPCKQYVCDPLSDSCVEANRPDGTGCEDGFGCTTGDSCQMGTCIGGPSVCKFEHNVIVLPKETAPAIEEIGECQTLVVSPEAAGLLVDTKPGDVIVLGNQENPIFCKAKLTSSQPDGSLTIEVEPASLDEAIPYGSFGFDGPVSYQQAGIGGGEDGFEWNESPDVYIPIPEVAISTDGLPVTVKMTQGHVGFYPWFTVKGDIDWMQLQWIAMSVTGSVDYQFGLAVEASGAAQLEKKWTLYPPKNVPEPTYWFMAGPVPIAISLSIEAKLKFKLEEAIEASYQISGLYQSSAGFSWDAKGGLKTMKSSPDPYVKKVFDLQFGGKGSLELSVKPKVTVKVAKVVGPKLTVGPSLKAEMEVDFLDLLLTALLKGCLSADIGGELKVFGAGLEISLELFKACLTFAKWEKCLDECTVGPLACSDAKTVKACAADGDADPCLDWKYVDCGAGKHCETGVCVPDCLANESVKCHDGNLHNYDGCGIVGSLKTTCPFGCVEGQQECSNCVADCGTLECGPDPVCGAECGPCKAGLACIAGKCVCTPKNCQQLGKQCGNWDGGCGKSVDCGVCSGADQCDASGKCVPAGPTCSDGICNGAETCSTCPVDCGSCCGNGLCDPGENSISCPGDCGPLQDCQPNSTCCTAQGTFVSKGQNGTNCQGECKECNGTGSCTDKPVSVSCAGGTGLCANGVCTVAKLLIDPIGSGLLGSTESVSCIALKVGTPHSFTLVIENDGQKVWESTKTSMVNADGDAKATFSVLLADLDWSPYVHMYCIDETLPAKPTTGKQGLYVFLPFSATPGTVAVGQDMTFQCNLTAAGKNHLVAFFVRVPGSGQVLASKQVNADAAGKATWVQAAQATWKGSVEAYCRDDNNPAVPAGEKPVSGMVGFTVQ